MGVRSESRRYLQPKLLAELDRAANLFDAGLVDEAEARAGLVLMRGPVNVSLDTPGMTIAERLTARQALDRAVQMWRDELGGDLQIAVVPKPFANVRVTWSAGQVAGGRCAGHAVWSRQVWSSGGRWRSEFSADIDLALLGSDGVRLPDATLAQAAAHEFGHVMGMDDSGRKGDLMGPVRTNRPVDRLSPREHDAIVDLRAEADTLADLCALRRDALAW
ncbi:MAG: matrixin family metalloprotease [Fimbriimonadaceae bacterium]|nr:matrixin family metalloprotease [Fimbriimonadaceae bacterium]